MKDIITLTQTAKEKLIDVAKTEPDSFLKITVKKGGCAGMEYDFSFQKDPHPDDENIFIDEVKIAIDRAAILFLIGAEMDYVSDTFSSKFVFNNPNVIDACGCGESVTFK